MILNILYLWLLFLSHINSAIYRQSLIYEKLSYLTLSVDLRKIYESQMRNCYSLSKIIFFRRLFNFTQMYREYKPIYDTYKNSINQERYFRRHEDEIMLFKEASDELLKTGRTVPNIGKLNADGKCFAMPGIVTLTLSITTIFRIVIFYRYCFDFYINKLNCFYEQQSFKTLAFIFLLLSKPSIIISPNLSAETLSSNPSESLNVKIFLLPIDFAASL